MMQQHSSIQTMGDDDYFGDAISTYTREQAIEDGVLFDVSEMAQEAGFKIPVAITQAVRDDCVVWTDKDAEKYYQDEKGRQWDVIVMAHLYARRNKSTNEFMFPLHRIPRVGHGGKRNITLKCTVHGGDNGEPVITIMQPNED